MNFTCSVFYDGVVLAVKVIQESPGEPAHQNVHCLQVCARIMCEMSRALMSNLSSP